MTNQLAQIQVPRPRAIEPLPNTSPAHPMTPSHLSDGYPLGQRLERPKHIPCAIDLAG